MSRLHDISIPVREGMITYPGNPPTRLRPHSRIADGDPANVTEFTFGSHNGTHLDAASHFIDGGQTVEEIPLERLIGPALVVQIDNDVRAIGERELRACSIEGATRILLKTRNSSLLRKDSFIEDFTYIDGSGADYLVSIGVELVAIDYLSVEEFDADEPVAHRTLLEREVVIVEGVDLNGVTPGRYELFCLPVKVAGVDGAPVRAVLREID
jgi:arylformamidase